MRVRMLPLLCGQLVHHEAENGVYKFLVKKV